MLDRSSLCSGGLCPQCKGGGPAELARPPAALRRGWAAAPAPGLCAAGTPRPGGLQTSAAAGSAAVAWEGAGSAGWSAAAG